MRLLGGLKLFCASVLLRLCARVFRCTRGIDSSQAQNDTGLHIDAPFLECLNTFRHLCCILDMQLYKIFILYSDVNGRVEDYISKG